MQKVRYRVLKPCFVNDTLHEPVKGKAVYVEAAPGLEGSALELCPDPGAGGRLPERQSPAPRKDTQSPAPARGEGSK